MTSFKMEGFDEMKKKLNTLQNNAKDLQGTHKIKFSELFPNQFMKEFTKFDSIEQMFEMSGYKVESAEDFKKIPDDKWNKFINSNTNFKNWQEMQLKASGEWAAKRLGL